MRVVGMLNHYLLSAMRIALFPWGIWLLVSYVRNKSLDIKLLGIRYVFITYLAGVFFVTGAYRVFEDGIPAFFMEPNLIPLWNTIQDIRSSPQETIALIAYNLILLIPFGFLLPFAFSHCNWEWKKIAILSFAFVLLVEILEYFSGRYMDIDDIVINTIGALVGYALYRCCRHVWMH